MSLPSYERKDRIPVLRAEPLQCRLCLRRAAIAGCDDEAPLGGGEGHGLRTSLANLTPHRSFDVPHGRNRCGPTPLISSPGEGTLRELLDGGPYLADDDPLCTDQQGDEVGRDNSQ